MYEITTKEQEWVERMHDPVTAKHCVQFAAAINRLDFSLIESLFTDETTYSNQKIYDTLKGQRASDYWQQIIDRFRELGADYKSFAELAQNPWMRPCILIIGREGGYSTHGMGRPSAYIDIEATTDEEIASIFSVNLLPSPNACRRSSLFPGLGSELAGAESYRGRSLPLSKHVTIYLFVIPALEEAMGMKDEFFKAITDFKPARHKFVSVSEGEPLDVPARDLCAKYGVHALPCIIVTNEGKLVKKIVGYKNESALRKAFNELFVR